MAVHVLAHAHTRSATYIGALSPAILAVALVPAALDLLKIVQPAIGAVLNMPTELASAAAAAVLLTMWIRYPRTAWLAAAGFAACASLALRLFGAEIAPALSLLAIFAVGIGGGFMNAELSPVDVSR